MNKRIHTIHHRGIAFFEKEDNWERNNWPTPSGVIYEGYLVCMPVELAAEVAEIHPNYMAYYEETMMPLYKHKVWKSGTEDPILCIAALMTKKEFNAYYENPWVVIWQITGK